MKTNVWKQFVLLFLFHFTVLFVQAGSLLISTSDSLAVAKHATVTTSIPLQSSVKNFTTAYLEEHSDLLDDIKERNSKTFVLIQKILVKRGVPAELMYLAIVESKLKNSATSGVGAAGVWQLMPVTARTLGLKVDGKTDQRRNIYHSSVAAADYLNDLYKQFDDWLLVVAAYNCGAGNVYKAIKQSGSRDFWKLQRYLPKETRDHVKRFIATHFYYEGEGSMATLTKTERIRYLASLEATITEDEENDTPAATLLPVRWVMMVQEEGKMVFVVRK
jgi:membrane-bound lytic murein transglycosylase D